MVDGRRGEKVVCDAKQNFKLIALPRATLLQMGCALTPRLPHISVIQVNGVRCAFPFPISVKISVTLHVDSMAV